MKRTLSLFFALCPLLSAFADNWPMWRGANGDGTTTESNLPEKWSQTENGVWKVALPERGTSTPVVWGDKVFVSQAIEKASTSTPRQCSATSCLLLRGNAHKQVSRPRP